MSITNEPSLESERNGQAVCLQLFLTAALCSPGARAPPEQSQPIPKNFVAVMDNRLLRTISWQAYQKIHPSDVESDYKKLLQHEMAHQLHTDLVGDDQMCPTWFCEGFAVAAAGQYVSAPPLNEHEIQRIICSKDRGDYRQYGSVLRILMKRHSLPELVEWARHADFANKLGFSSCG